MTEEWFNFLNNLREQLKEEWANSVFVGGEGEITLQRNSAAIGQVDLLTRLLQATVEDVAETSYDKEH